jgi:hypothetical protein
MSTAAKSLLVFAVYLIGMGLGLVIAPNLVLGSLGFPPVTDVWSRVVGVLALLLAFYYAQAARAEFRPFMRWTVYARIATFVFFLGFVVAGLAGPMLIALGALDLAAALWTARALTHDPRPAHAQTAVQARS